MWLSPAGAEPGNILPDGAAPQAHVVPAGRGHAAHPALLAATAILATEQSEQVPYKYWEMFTYPMIIC